MAQAAERFVTPCALPSEHERELLTILIEECAEVQQRASVTREVAELPDRTSPADWPEAMLVTSDELFAIVMGAANAALASRARAGDGSLEAIASAIDAASFAHPERMRPFVKANRSDREHAFRLARAAVTAGARAQAGAGEGAPEGWRLVPENLFEQNDSLKIAEDVAREFVRGYAPAFYKNPDDHPAMKALPITIVSALQRLLSASPHPPPTQSGEEPTLQELQQQLRQLQAKIARRVLGDPMEGVTFPQSPGSGEGR